MDASADDLVEACTLFTMLRDCEQMQGYGAAMIASLASSICRTTGYVLTLLLGVACIAVTDPQVNVGDELLAAMGTEVADYLQTLKSKSRVGGLEFPTGSMQLLGSCAIVCTVTAARLRRLLAAV